MTDLVDEVITGQRNNLVLSAQNDDGPPQLLEFLKPFEELSEVEEKYRSRVEPEKLVAPETILNFQFKEYLRMNRINKDFLLVCSDIANFKKKGASQSERKDMAAKLFRKWDGLTRADRNSVKDQMEVTDLEKKSVSPRREVASETREGGSDAVSDESTPQAKDRQLPVSSLPGQVGDKQSPVTPEPLNETSVNIKNDQNLRSWLLTESPKSLEITKKGSGSVTLWLGVLAELAKYAATFTEDFLISPQYERFIQLKEYTRRPIQLENFNVYRILGRGAFGAVQAVQKIDTKQMFAAKAMSKRIVKKNKSEWLVEVERKILSRTKSPFVLNLAFAFCEKDHFYLIFRLLNGGDLHYHLNREAKGHFTVERARFHAAEVALGLEHLHAMNVVYRDLKPANILMDEEGHCVISDLGLAMQIRPDKPTKGYGGTPGYMAPEIMSRQGAKLASDWWTFGVFLYEMIRGKLPGKCKCNSGNKEWCTWSKKHKDVAKHSVENGWHCVLNVDYSSTLDEVAVDFFQKVFVVDPEQRLGAGGASEMKSHPFFATIDWGKLARKELVVPYKPGFGVHAQLIGEVGSFDEAKYAKVDIGSEKDDKLYDKFQFVDREKLEQDVVATLQVLHEFKTGRRVSVHPFHSPAHRSGSCCTIL